jgi:DnaJ homolog subfamily A member 5
MFVRKRDPRYKAYIARQAKPAERASTPASGTATPKRSVPTPTFVAQDWQKVAEPSDSAADLEWSRAEGAEDEEWECVACNKTFRSEAAWNSHERSKKHLRAVEQLKREMQNEELELDLGGQDGDEFADAGVKNQDQESDDEDRVTAPESAADATVDGSGDNDPPVATPDRRTEAIPKKEGDTAEGEEFSLRPGIRQERAKITAQTSSSLSPTPQVPKTSKKGRARAARDSSRQQTGGDLLFSEEDRETTLTPGESHHARDGAAADDATSAREDSTKGEVLSKREKRRAREAAKKARESEAKSGCAVSFSDLILSHSIRARVSLFLWLPALHPYPGYIHPLLVLRSVNFDVRLIAISNYSATFVGRRSRAGRNCSNTSTRRAMNWQIRVLVGRRQRKGERRRNQAK